MKVTDRMVSKAAAVVPTLTESTVRKMLEVALSGSVCMVAGKGRVMEEGKSTFPDYMQLEVTDSYEALSLAMQLISAVQLQPGATNLERPAILLIAGESGLSYDE